MDIPSFTLLHVLWKSNSIESYLPGIPQLYTSSYIYDVQTWTY